MSEAITGSQQRTAENIIERFSAGDTIPDLAADYDLTADCVSLILAAYQAGREEALQEIDRLAGEIGDMEVWRSTDLRTTGLQAGWIAEAEEWEINVSGTNLTEALEAAANPNSTEGGGE